MRVIKHEKSFSTIVAIIFTVYTEDHYAKFENLA